jgi:O-antigen ligase
MMVFTAFGTDTIPAASYVTERFASIGDDPGSVGRLVLWQGGLDVWRHYPWGVGVGHAISALEHLRGIDVPEDNLHNLPLQHLVEGGPLLALLLLGCMLLIFRQTAHAWRGARVDLPIWLFVALYCVTGWLQFRGADVIAWTILGCAIGTAPRRRSRLTQMADRDRSSLPGRPDLSCR